MHRCKETLAEVGCSQVGHVGVGGKTGTAENEREGCVCGHEEKVSRDDILTSHPHPTSLYASEHG